MSWFKFYLESNNEEGIETRINEILELGDTILGSESITLWQHQEYSQKFYIEIPVYLIDGTPNFIFMERHLGVIFLPWTKPDLSKYILRI